MISEQSKRIISMTCCRWSINLFFKKKPTKSPTVQRLNTHELFGHQFNPTIETVSSIFQGLALENQTIKCWQSFQQIEGKNWMQKKCFKFFHKFFEISKVLNIKLSNIHEPTIRCVVWPFHVFLSVFVQPCRCWAFDLFVHASISLTPFYI